MSGSLPLPLRPAQEASGDPSSLYPPSRPQDVYQGNSTHIPPNDSRAKLTATPLPMARSYPQEESSSTDYPYPRTEQSGSLGSYSLPHIHGMAQANLHPPFLQTAGPSSAEAYPIPSRSSGLENPPYTSPKSQRKTKGHVASACVPCKRAHLRCDAQRPCSRCLGNGKEDACIDVQHKKRGRPRLRDEREARFDQSRFPHHQDVVLKRPLNIYPSVSPGPSSYEDSLRRSESYRSPESQLGGISRSYQDRPSMPDSSIYDPSFATTPSPPEPMAYLNVDFEFVKASPTFIDAIRGSNLASRKLSDIVTPSQATLVYSLQNQIINEQRSKEPNYLPPILGRIDQAIRELGFTGEDIGRFRLDRQEYLSFVGSDGYSRTWPLRFGLAKEGSFYFVVILLNLQHSRQPPPPPPHPSSSMHMRDHSLPHRQLSTTPLSNNSDHISTSTPFDPHRHRPSESMASGQRHSMSLSNLSLSSGASYSPPTRAEYSAPLTYPPLRTEHTPVTRLPAQHSYQLPPIRAQSDPRDGSRDSGWIRDERSGRVDIGGLIEKPSASGK